jgi:uncharacterized protein
MSDEHLDQRLDACRRILSDLASVVIGFSGGVDSSLLLHLSREQLGAGNVLAALAVCRIMPAHEIAQARGFVGDVELVELQVDPLADPAFVANRPDRCYGCKTAIFSAMVHLAQKRGIAAVCSGTNADDVGDYRPGLRAEKELGIVQPLRRAGLTKADIRALSRRFELTSAQLPSMACLASRIPYGQPITVEALGQIEAGEQVLREAGFTQYRLRHHGQLARIEVPPDQLDAAWQMREQLVEQIGALGFAYVTLDLAGFRSGAMNETLS